MRRHQPRVIVLSVFLLSLFLASCGGHGGGGGGGGGTPTPKLRVDFTSPSSFSPSQQGASYTLTVRNQGNAATSGMVTLTQSLLTGLTVTSIAGPNWTCTLATTTCTRSDALAAGASYDPITVIGNVTAPAGGFASATVTVTGGGAAAFSGSGSVPVVTTGAVVTITRPGVLSAQVVAGSTLSLQATVNQGDNGTGVNWGVQAGDTCSANGFTSNLGTQGGNASLGTVPMNSMNGTVVTYSPPNSAPAAPNNVFTITALQSPSTTGPCIVVTVVATNNNLFSANYVFRFRGFTSAGLTFAIIGRFHADGVGKADVSSGISAGLEDVNIAQADGSSMSFTKVAFTGGYNMDSPSHGTMKLIVTGTPWAATASNPPLTMDFSFTLSLDGTFGGLIETDGNAGLAYAGSGDFQIQGPSKNFNVNRFFPSYVLSLEGPAGAGTTAVHKGLIGRLDLTATAGSSTAGTIANTSTGDDQSGTAPKTPLSGTYLIDDTVNGHGLFTIVGSANPHVSFYIIRPGVFYALRTDQNVASANPDGILLGAVHSIGVDANGMPVNFDNTSLNGSFIFNLLGITTNGHASAAAGHFSGIPSSGTGTLAGFMDINDGGAVSSPSFGPIRPDTATFTISANGRGTWAIKLSGVTYNFVFYARGAGRGFLLEQPASDTSNRGRSGGWLVQTSGPFAASGANGTYILATAVVTAGAASVNSLAVLSLNGGADNSGNFNGTSYASVPGSALTTTSISGTFTVTDTTNGRGTIALTSGKLAGNSQAAFEVYDSADVLLVGTDATNTDPQIIFLDE
jgi:hypothetical protein